MERYRAVNSSCYNSSVGNRIRFLASFQGILAAKTCNGNYYKGKNTGIFIFYSNFATAQLMALMFVLPLLSLLDVTYITAATLLILRKLDDNVTCHLPLLNFIIFSELYLKMAGRSYVSTLIQ